MVSSDISHVINSHITKEQVSNLTICNRTDGLYTKSGSQYLQLVNRTGASLSRIRINIQDYNPSL